MDNSPVSNPYMLNPPYALWAIWRGCGWLERLVFVLLGVLIVYSLFLGIVALIRLHSLTSGESVELATIRTLRKHWTCIQQTTLVLFYLFGAVLFLVLQNVGMTIGDGGSGYVVSQILANFIFACAFATNVFLGFALLQIIQWLVSNRLNVAQEALGTNK